MKASISDAIHLDTPGSDTGRGNRPVAMRT